jgi:hypothetical protein
MASYWKPAAQLNQMREAQRYHEFKNLPKQSRQASILYPSLVPKETRQAMSELTEAGKKPPQPERLLKDSERGATSPLDGRAKR